MRVNRLHRTTAQAAVAAMAFLATLLSTAIPAHAAFVSVNQDAFLSNFALSTRHLAISGTDPQYGDVNQYPFQHSAGSRFWIRDHHPNGHTIQEIERPSRCLDSNGGGDVYGIPCNGGNNQRWRFNHLGKQRDGFGTERDAYEIRSRATGLCLDANSDYGYTLACNGGNYQRWFMYNP